MKKITIHIIIILVCLIAASCSYFKNSEKLTYPDNMKPELARKFINNDDIIIQNFEVPRFSVNNYLLASKKSGDAVLIDFGGYNL